jgi:hypothetical protein
MTFERTLLAFTRKKPKQIQNFLDQATQQRLNNSFTQKPKSIAKYRARNPTSYFEYCYLDLAPEMQIEQRKSCATCRSNGIGFEPGRSKFHS